MSKVTINKAVVVYRLLLGLYPKSYLKEYKILMEQTFRDMLKDNNTFILWFRVLKELPSSLLQEHLDSIKRRKKMEIIKRNYNLGLTALIVGYLTVISWALAIFTGIEIGINIISYTVIGSFGFLLLSSGVLFITSLVFNIKEARISHRLTSGLKFTLISIPPIAFCYLAIIVKALTEGH